MKENFSTYKNRIYELVQNRACFPFEWETFITAQGLLKKFDYEGNYKPFYGDTIVYLISEKDQLRLSMLQEELYNCAGYMLSNKLPFDTFHITLHDLNASEDKEIAFKKIENHKNDVFNLFQSINKNKIHLKSSGIVSMVASSLVLLFEPVSEEDHEIIQEIYSTFDEICPLSYPLTLHCTLAYYKPNEYNSEEWNNLMRKVLEINAWEPIEIKLDSTSLKYQCFYSMKDYVDIERKVEKNEHKYF